ncbi:MAG: SufD family Fe-S cluster assembly protein [Epsilonproteobacteria bacterium]|nr:SufD family Fe-S cluster assembly protein [Campylobacterota bacterium]
MPLVKLANSDSVVVHEASAGKINEDFLFYLQSRGIDSTKASSLIVN